MPVRAILFDFDGTLADSFEAITASTNHVRGTAGLEPLPEAEIRRHVGLGLARLMQDLVPGVPVEEAVTRYREHHPRVLRTGTRLYPGVAETLTDLNRRGFRMAICSNKRVDFTRQLVNVFGLARFFTAVLGPEDVHQPKPDPAMLVEGLRQLEVKPGEALYVGDMAVDVETGRAAGVPVWLVAGGAADSAAARAAQPDRVLNRFAELLDHLPEQP